MELLLKKREILDLGKATSGMRIDCQAGWCWVTQSGDERDHILRAGGSFTPRGAGQLLISAGTDCRLGLRAESNARLGPPIWSRLCLSS